MQLLKDLVGVSRQTVLRWKVWWQQVLPKSPFWRAARGALRLSLELCELPQSLLDEFSGPADAYFAHVGPGFHRMPARISQPCRSKISRHAGPG